MLTASQKFQDHLRMSHMRLCRVGLWLPDETGAYVQSGYLGVVSGDLTLDRTRNIRRQARLTVSTLESTLANEFTGSAARDFLESLTAQSAEITIEWGLRFPDLTEEYVQLARLRVEETSVDDIGASVEISSAYDGGTRVADLDLILPYAPYDAGGTKLTCLDAIQDLVNGTYPSTHQPTWHIDPSISTTTYPPDGTVFTGNRWDAVQALAAPLSADVYADENGDWRVVPSTPGTTHVWLANAGESGVLVRQTTQYSRREQYNAVAIRWESPLGGGGLVYLVDADPASPTYYDGPFGKKPRPEETVSTITTEAQAIEYARSILYKYTGRTRSISLDTLHNPLLEAGDVIGVILTDGSGERHVVDSISIPLTGGTMSMETRLLRGGVTYSSSDLIYSDTAYTYAGQGA